MALDTERVLKSPEAAMAASARSDGGHWREDSGWAGAMAFLARIAATAAARNALLAQPQLFDQRPIAVGVARLQIVEQLAAARNHPEQAATRVMVLDVDAEVVVETVDARSQERDLHLG